MSAGAHAVWPKPGKHILARYILLHLREEEREEGHLYHLRSKSGSGAGGRPRLNVARCKSEEEKGVDPERNRVSFSSFSNDPVMTVP